MKKLLRNFALAAVAVMGAASCTVSMIDDDIALSVTEGLTLYASTPSDESTTKVEFADNDTEGIALSWELGDQFTICEYRDTRELATFVCTDVEAGAFTTDNLELVLDSWMTYDAYYKGVDHCYYTDLSEQDGDEINNLSAACKMVATFTYEEGENTPITFEHINAIMTFKFSSAERPAYLIFENGDESYKVTYTELEPVNDLYTSHIMIDPCAATSRTLTFSLYAEGADEPYDVRTVPTSKAYVAGYRYTSPVSDLDPTIWLGSGTEGDPYQITTSQQLRDFSTSVNAGEPYIGEYFVMTNDIDLGGIDAAGNITEANEFTAIGTSDNKFKGNFDGGGYEVSGLYINQPDSNYQGLFGSVSYGRVNYTWYDAVIKNLRVSGSVTGKSYVGGIVGVISGDTTGDTSNYTAMVDNCYSSVTVSGESYVGGVAGRAYYCWVSNCANSESVEGSVSSIGGIVGYHNYGILINSYNTGSVSGGEKVGGIVGEVYAGSTTKVVNCYMAGKVSGDSYVGGVAGHILGYEWYGTSNPTATNCFYNYDLFDGDILGRYSEYTITSANQAYSTSIMQSSFFVNMLNSGAYTYNESSNTAEAYAWQAEANSYPVFDTVNAPTYTNISATAYGSGTEGDPYLIYSAEQLEDLASNVNNKVSYYSGIYFRLANDINLGGSADNPWTAIGGNGSTTIQFEGSFDGGGYTISGLYIDAATSYQGLFGSVENATIKNLTVEGSVTQSGDELNVAGIVGYAINSTIANCHNKAKVSGYSRVAGIVGYSHTGTIITNCYNEAEITCDYGSIGGIAGWAYESTIANCGNIGSITCESYQGVGGVAGYSTSSSFANCYNYAAVRSSLLTGANVSCSYGGGFVGYIATGSYSTASLFANCYYNTDYNRRGQGITDSDNYTGMTSAEMQAESFVATLNDNAYLYNCSAPATAACAWVAESGSSPMLDIYNFPTTISGYDIIANNGGIYEIYTAAGLTAFADLVNGNSNTSGATTYGTISFDSAQPSINGKLRANITLSGSWTPIGSLSNQYSGIFDGDSYKVSGISVNDDKYYLGLFGYTSGATIKNLAVAGSVTTTSGTNIGGVVGCAGNGSLIINCYNEVTINGQANVGGIAGSLVASSIVVNCYNTAAIGNSDFGYPQYFGGIVGFVDNSTITNCYNTAAISETTSGGVAGIVSGSSYISSCYYNSSTTSVGYGEGIAEITIITAKSDSEMKATDFVTLLNAGAESYNSDSPSVEACSWAATSTYPTFAW